jgi:hypothetical protein
MLVGASPPEMDSVVAADVGSYPTCSARITDRCVQRGEREAVARSEGPRAAPVRRADPPRAIASTTAYPPCSATVRDRCQQIRGARSAGRAAGRAPVRHRQLAYHRAGERG